MNFLCGWGKPFLDIGVENGRTGERVILMKCACILLCEVGVSMEVDGYRCGLLFLSPLFLSNGAAARVGKL